MTHHRPNRPITAGRPVKSRAASFGMFAGTTLAALLAALPLDVTVTLGDSTSRPVVIVSQVDVPNPICQAMN
ncbi:hypothetical protein ACIQVL_46645 [Streptomyces sp. NPDC090499]|uniref:hypothetical protein n=1 Tax=Streptomyces sp. NPDC090499 TaxID=3365965 RepID=UPI0038216A2A